MTSKLKFDDIYSKKKVPNSLKKLLRTHSDNDFTELLELIRWKLVRMKKNEMKFIKSGEITEDSRSKSLDSYTQVIQLITDYLDDKKYYEKVEKFEKEHGKLQMKTTKLENGMVRVDSMYFDGEDPNNNEVQDKLHAELVNLDFEVEKMRKKDLNKIFSLISKNIENWWI